MKKKYDLVVYIGRFQPVHNAHVEILRRAGTMANKVLAIVGSANLPRTYKNPWTSKERGAMLMEVMVSLQKETGAKYAYEHVHNSIYNNTAWAVRVQAAVKKHAQDGDKIAIIGHEKDDSSFYLKMFPQWERVEVPLIEPLDATQIRQVYFTPETCNLNWFAGVVPMSTQFFLRSFKDSKAYNQVVKEKEFVENYKKQFATLPYPPIFVTVDAVVVQAGHVLMIRRRSEPGKGLWALPGGFVNAQTDASMEDAMLRELREETGIKVPEKVLRGSIESNHVFDAIDRSARGRTITHAFFIAFDDGEWNLPKIRGADDADKARWVPINDIKREESFEDHFDIIEYFLGVE
jgi:bifunctional NMN adenylyltransferase/nudix hydrolase